MVLLPIWSCFCLIRLVGSDIRTTVFFKQGTVAYPMAYPMAYPKMSMSQHPA